MHTTQTTLGEWAAQGPQARGVLLRYKLDFCCGGRQPLDLACTRAGLEVEQVMEALLAQPQTHEPPEDWKTRPLPELVDHILERYHAPLLPHLDAVIAAASKVERVHGAKPSCPKGLADHLQEVRADLLSHMAKEEQVLFPAIRAGRRGAALGGPVSIMTHEHDDHGVNLKRTRALAHDLIPPPEACATWRTLYDELARLESDLMDHIHLENHVLFPRTLQDA